MSRTPFDEYVENYIRSLPWSGHGSRQSAELEMALIAGNIRSFAKKAWADWVEPPSDEADTELFQHGYSAGTRDAREGKEPDHTRWRRIYDGDEQ